MQLFDVVCVIAPHFERQKSMPRGCNSRVPTCSGPTNDALLDGSLLYLQQHEGLARSSRQERKQEGRQPRIVGEREREREVQI